MTPHNGQQKRGSKNAFQKFFALETRFNYIQNNFSGFY